MMKRVDNGANEIFDKIINDFSLKNDRELSEKLGISQPIICKARYSLRPINSFLILKIHEFTGITIREIKSIARVE